MNPEISTAGAAAPARRAPRARRTWLHPGAGVVAAWLLAALAYVVASRAQTADLAAHVLLLLAPVGAAVACVLAARSARDWLRRTWLIFAAAALAVALRELFQGSYGLLPQFRGPALSAICFGLLIAAHVAIALGCALAIPPLRSRGVLGGILLDVTLVLAAGGLFAVKLAMGHGEGSVPALPLLRTLAGHLSAALSMTLAGMLLVWREPGLRLPAAAGVAAATIVFALGNVLLTLGMAPSLPPGVLDLLWVTGWASLAFAGLTAARARGMALVRTRPPWAVRTLGGVLIPAAALYMIALAVDYALRPYVAADIGLALWFLAAPLALRLGQGLRSEVHEQEQGQELVNARALVELNRALAAAVELEPTLQLITRWAARLSGARAAGIQLLAGDQSTLELRAVTGLPPVAVGLALPVRECLTGAVALGGRARNIPDWTRLTGVHPRERALFGEGSGAAAPLLFRDRPLGVLVVAGRRRPLEPQMLEVLASLADSAAVAIENARLFEEVRALSLIDPLTHLANRRALEHDLEREFAAAERGRALCAVLFDIDGFKRCNDTLGHLAGDEALRALGAVLHHETRAMNLAARYGGDEFMVLLSDCEPDGAAFFAERSRSSFRTAVAEHGWDLDVTYGIARYERGMRSPADLIAAADRALYLGKGRGSSAVETLPPDASAPASST